MPILVMMRFRSPGVDCCEDSEGKSLSWFDLGSPGSLFVGRLAAKCIPARNQATLAGP
jgi:hypothetical protein